MPVLGERSHRILQTCDARLIRVANEAIKSIDFAVLSGHREEAEQNELYRRGASKKKYPYSKHNLYLYEGLYRIGSPSAAVDLGYWDPFLGAVDWDDEDGFRVMAGHVLRVAWEFETPLVWGGNWDGDADYEDEDQHFWDLGHFHIAKSMSESYNNMTDDDNV